MSRCPEALLLVILGNITKVLDIRVSSKTVHGKFNRYTWQFGLKIYTSLVCDDMTHSTKKYVTITQLGPRPQLFLNCGFVPGGRQAGEELLIASGVGLSKRNG